MICGGLGTQSNFSAPMNQVLTHQSPSERNNIEVVRCLDGTEEFNEACLGLDIVDFDIL